MARLPQLTAEEEKLAQRGAELAQREVSAPHSPRRKYRLPLHTMALIPSDSLRR